MPARYSSESSVRVSVTYCSTQKHNSPAMAGERERNYHGPLAQSMERAALCIPPGRGVDRSGERT